ncbi:hypothetical protein AX14_014264 [Amanita brunnescens Koide BX004]|nr:hypothetical protein AX14_014264 [Amanita brunnescens Koide BX004]
MSYPLIRACTEGSVLLPKYIYIQDKDGRYLRTDDSWGRFGFGEVGGQPDSNCIFKTEYHSDSDNYDITCTTGAVAWFTPGDGWVSLNTGGQGWHVSVIHTSGNDVYLYMVVYNVPRFLYNELNSNGTLPNSTDITYKSRFQVTEAVLKTEITNIEYDLDNATIDDTVPPTIALRTMVQNNSDDNVSQTLAFSYAHCKTGTWSNTLGITVGTQTSVKADVPFLAEGKVTLSFSANYSHTWGGSESVTETVTSTTLIALPGHKKARVTVIIRNAKIEVNFKYTVKKWYMDGSTESTTKDGVYKNVDSYLVDTVADNWSSTT